VLKVFYSNIRSIHKNFNDVESFILNNNFDVLTLCECWVNEISYIPVLSGYNYKCIPSCYGKSGGIVTYFKDTLNVELIEARKSSAEAKTEILSINELEEFITSNIIKLHNLEGIICGDFNIDLFSKGKLVDQYKSLVSALNCTFLINEPTRVTTDTATCIDHVFVFDNTNNNIEAKVLDFKASDHNSIAISAECNRHNHRSKVISRRSFHEKNVLRFITKLSEIDWDSHICSRFDINQNLSNFLLYLNVLTMLCL